MNAYGIRGEYPLGPGSDANMLNLAASLGALPLVRCCAEVEGVSLTTPYLGRTAVIDAANTGERVLHYICERLEPKDLDYITLNEGFSAMAVAAYGGHEAVLETLISFGADVHVRRSNGRTLFHQAALSGCVGAARVPPCKRRRRQPDGRCRRDGRSRRATRRSGMWTSFELLFGGAEVATRSFIA